MNLCAFTIMYAGEHASSSGIFLWTVEKVACMLQKKAPLALSPSDMRR